MRAAMATRLETSTGSFDVHGFVRGDDRYSVQKAPHFR